MQHRRRKLVRVKHVIRLGTGVAFKEALQALGFSGRVNTAFIERVNLTIRRAARGQRPCKPHIWKPTYTGGSPIITSCGPTARCAWSFKDEQAKPRLGDPGTDTARQPWPLGGRGIGGLLSICSATRCHHSQLEPFREPTVRLLPGLKRAGGGKGPGQDTAVLALLGPVFPREAAKMSPKTSFAGLFELSPVCESCTPCQMGQTMQPYSCFSCRSRWSSRSQHPWIALSMQTAFLAATLGNSLVEQ